MPTLMQGRARDLLTPADGGAPTVLAEDHFTILASPMREILSIEVSPDGPTPRGWWACAPAALAVGH